MKTLKWILSGIKAILKAFKYFFLFGCEECVEFKDIKIKRRWNNRRIA